LKFQGGAHELFHLTAIVLQLVIALAVSQVKFFEAGEFYLEFCNLFEGEMGDPRYVFVASLRYLLFKKT